MITLMILLAISSSTAFVFGLVAYDQHQARLRARLEHMREIGALHARHYDVLHPKRTRSQPDHLAGLVVIHGSPR